MVVHVDGGARGNPGPAGIGVVVSLPDGTELDRANDYIGEATNNVAEYRAVLLGIERAKAAGAKKLQLVNDSELVARQLVGEYKVKHAGLRPLHAESLDALDDFEQWSIRSVRREANDLADQLVNDAIDAKAPTT